jgi:hypothetical protein
MIHNRTVSPVVGLNRTARVLACTVVANRRRCVVHFGCRVNCQHWQSFAREVVRVRKYVWLYVIQINKPNEHVNVCLLTCTCCRDE